MRSRQPPAKDSSDVPYVTVIMPIRNEAHYIERSLGAVVSQDYPPDRMEVLVVDGMSDDGTRDIVRQMKDDGSSIVLLDNPRRIVPTALNIGLRRAQGDVIVRVDGHCEIAPDYLRRCICHLERTGAACVGGPIKTVGETFVARAIALAMSSTFGVGNSAFRTLKNQARYVDTVAFGAYRREIFDRIGTFDEELVRNQDDEFNFRLTQVGGKIWLDPSLQSVYYSRANLRGLFRQYFQYGVYKIRVIQKRNGVPSWRHLVPGAFVLGVLGSFLLAIFARRPLCALGVTGPYALANGVASLWMARKDWRTLPLLPLAFLTLHLAYGIGFLWGLWRWRKGWSQVENTDL